MGITVGRLIYNSVWFVLMCGLALGQASSGSIDEDWRSYGHDPGGMRFSPLKQINQTNVRRHLRYSWKGFRYPGCLRLAWQL